MSGRPNRGPHNQPACNAREPTDRTRRMLHVEASSVMSSSRLSGRSHHTWVCTRSVTSRRRWCGRERFQCKQMLTMKKERYLLIKPHILNSPIDFTIHKSHGVETKFERMSRLRTCSLHITIQDPALTLSPPHSSLCMRLS